MTKMTKRNRIAKAGLIVALFILLATFSGCASAPRRAHQRYTFIESHATLKKHYSDVYSKIAPRMEQRANLVFTHPNNGFIRFGGQTQIDIGKKRQTSIPFAAGVYPFELARTADRKVMLTGALMVYNVDNSVGLATIGKTDDTMLFNQEMLRKAYNGNLSRYTIALDSKDIVTYWLGNRTSSYRGGSPTVELDFSAIPGISELRVNGRHIKQFLCTVPVFRTVQQMTETYPRRRVSVNVGLEHRIEFTANGKRYKGFVRKLVDNEFTAFVRIPCAIPQSLLDAAAAGTISRFTIQSSGDSQENVAEIVISGV